MSGQIPNSTQPDSSTTSHNQETKTFSSQSSTASLNDPIFVAIHDAFLLGWSLFELKSRVLIAATNTGTPNSKTHTASVAKVFAPTASASDFASRASNLIDLSASEVWSTIQTVNSSTSSTSNPLETSSSPTLFTEPINNAPLTYVWRELFNRIAFLHCKHFPHSNTNNTYYDPPDRRDLPYLYPVDSPDYATFGIDTIKDEYLQNFKLYESARRALNCLTLLYTRPEESFSPETVCDFQRRLVQVIQGKQPTAAQGDDLQTGPSQRDLNDAIKICSGTTVSFLVAWDGYLRENFNAGRESENNEIEQIAYEAGYSLASLSWNVSVMIAPIENTLCLTSQEHLHANPYLKQYLYKTWQNVFNMRNITSIQNQISALSTALDDAYYRTKKRTQHSEVDSVLERLHPDLPSLTIEAVKHSLDYWRRAVMFICAEDVQSRESTEGLPPPAEASKLSGIPGMTGETSTQLRMILIQQAGIWQSLLLCRQSLQNFTAEYVTQRIQNDFMREFEQALYVDAIHSYQNRYHKIGQQIRNGFRLVVVLGLLILTVVLISWLGQKFLAPLTVFFGTATVVIGLVGSLLKPPDSPSQEGQPPPVPKEKWLLSLDPDAFQRGREQILIDFNGLNQNVSITYPLVEFFILHSAEVARSNTADDVQSATSTAGFLIKDAYDFLVQVVWTNQERADEVGRIARSAFGPIGAFVGVQIAPSSNSS